MGADTFVTETQSPAETEALGIRLACVLDGGMVIVLAGELGTGKTVFIRGVACGLNMPPGVVVTSPSYVLQHIYRGGRLTLYHIDLYRIVGGPAEFEASGLRECLDDRQGVVCVEWPERLTGFQWPPDRVTVRIEHIELQQRRVSIRATGPRSLQALQRLATPNGRLTIE